MRTFAGAALGAIITMILLYFPPGALTIIGMLIGLGIYLDRRERIIARRNSVSIWDALKGRLNGRR